MAVVVRYRAKSERADENQNLIEKVFAQLAERRPQGFRYMAVRLEDGSFIHIVDENGEGGESLTDLPAFKAFVAEVGDRCVEPPAPIGGHIVGSYRFGPV